MDTIWKDAQAALKKRIAAHSYRMWIEPLQLTCNGDGGWVVTCPNAFSRRRVQEHFGALIEAELRRLSGDPQGRVGQSTPRATHLIKVACQTALGQRGELEVFGTDYDTPDGTCLRDYIHVSDLISAHVDALGHLRKGGESGIFNCGYGKGYSVLEVIRAVEKAHGGPVRANRVARRAGDPVAIIAGADRVRSVLGWEPQYDDLDAIVASALAWENHLLRRNAA